MALSRRLLLLVALWLPLWLLALPAAGLAAGTANAPAAAEALLDDPELDPGTGTPLALGGDAGEAARIATGTLDLSAAAPGAHALYLRFQDQTGAWSAPLGQSFYQAATGPHPGPGGENRIQAAEAFIDQDPGQGRGIALATPLDGSIDSAMEALRGTAALTGLPPGPHVLAVRFLDDTGVWSAPMRQSFFLAAASTPGSGPTRLVAADGQVDGGAPIALPADDGAFDDLVEFATLSATVGDGYHRGTIRFQDNLGLWSNTDPGPGGCTAIPITGRLLDGTTNAPLAGVTVSAGGRTAVTDAGGGFSIDGLPCGPQVVTVNVPGYEPYRWTFDPARGGWLTIRLTLPGTTYGPGTDAGYGGDPVNTATGNYVYSALDLEIPGVGHPFRFARSYNSRAASTAGAPGTPLGYGWSHGYQVGLTNAAGVVILTWGDGHTETFAPDGYGGFRPQYGVFATLTDLGGGRFALRQRDGIRYDFDTAGRLATITDRNGNAQTLTYTNGRLTRVLDSAGRAIDLTYDGAGRLTQVADALGRTLRYGYDGTGNLTSATDPNGNLTRYTYDARHQLLTAVDPRGHTIVNNTYDAERRVVTYQTDAKGGATSYAYQEADRVTTITDALGGATVHFHDDLLRLIRERDAIGAEAWYVYDEAGNRVQTVGKNGHLTEYEYDDRGNVTRQRDALGQVTSIVYDALNNPLTRTDALGHTTRFDYDDQGNRLATLQPDGGAETLTYDARGLPLTRTDPLGRTTSYAYDVQGNRIGVTDALGGTTHFTYDAVGRRLTRTDALGRTSTWAYDAKGNLLTLTDAAGQVTRYAYDANDNRISVTDRLGQTTTLDYDEKDLLVTVTDPAGGSVRSTYDALDRKTGVTDRNGHATRTDYDAVGHPIRVTDALGQVTESAVDANGNRLSVTDPLGHASRFTYDRLNRPVTAEDALGQRTATTYDALGRVVSRTDANGQTTRMRFDALGRLTEVTDAAGGRVEYAYDLAGNRLSLTNPTGQTTHYAYDALNRLISKVEPLGATTSYAYDAVGNLTALTKPDGTLIRYAYDALDRLVRVTYPDATQVDFGYDAEGHRTTVQDRLGTSRFVYDALGRLTGYTDPRGYAVGYNYDAQGNRTRLTYPGGQVATYGYDAADRLTTVTDWFGRSTRYAYDAAGRLTETVNPNGTRALNEYDAADRLTGLTNRRADGANLASYAYTLDGVGNPLTESRDEPLNPLHTAQAIDYAYDAEDRLTAANGVANAFDANGNQTGQGTATFTFDFEDRLVRSDRGGLVRTYGYDGLGQRLTRTLGGVTTGTVLDPLGALSAVLAETDAAGTVRASFLYGLGLVARIAPDGATRYYHYDSRGSTMALTDASGAVTDRYAYDPFGAVTESAGATANPFRYVGRHGLMDEGDGWLYVRARYYDPASGRFVSKDPMPGSETDSQALHRYLYALDNPVRLVDVSGLSAREGVQPEDYRGSSDRASDHGYETISILGFVMCDANDSLVGYLACAESIANDQGLRRLEIGATYVKTSADVVMKTASCFPGAGQIIGSAYDAFDKAIGASDALRQTGQGNSNSGAKFVVLTTGEVISEGLWGCWAGVGYAGAVAGYENYKVTNGRP